MRPYEFFKRWRDRINEREFYKDRQRKSKTSTRMKAKEEIRKEQKSIAQMEKGETQ